MDTKNLVTMALVVLVGFLGFSLTKTSQPVVVQTAPTTVGAFPGPDLGQRVVTQSGFAEAGQFSIATTASAMTLKDADLANNAIISLAAMGSGQAALALTLPASTSWPSLNKPGVVQRWIIDATTLTAATTTTITAGVGVDIDGTTANDDVLNGGVSGRLDCWRLGSAEGGNIRCIVEEMVDAG